MKAIHTLLILILITATCSCKKKGVDAPVGGQQPPPSPEVKIDDDTKDYGPYTPYPEGYPKSLNVVYFLPSDYKGPLNQYQRRISTLMLFMQDWYKKEMMHYGFGEKTFALLRSTKDPAYIKIIVVRGKENRYYYPYDGGGSKARTEIEEYFTKNPGEKASNHTMVFIPSLTGDGKGNNEGGVPFYGLGKYCFALDYRYFDVSFFPVSKDTANVGWIAGTIHELGHGLNLPHNTQKASDDFISLMHDHMAFTKNHAKSHITYADACILNTSQTFNKSGHPYYRSQSGVDIKTLRINADDNNIYYRAKFSASPRVNSVVIYNDPKTSEGDADYNSVTWATSTILQAADGKDSVAIDMPVADILSSYRQFPFDMRVRFCHEDGTFTVQNYKYLFLNGTHATINEELYEFTEISPQGWTITTTSTNNGSPASMLTDNNANTIWHSKWQGSVDPLPHSITIDMGVSHTVKGIAFTARQDRSDGRPNNIRIEGSSDGNSWQEIISTSLKDTPTKQIVAFPSPQLIKYIRVKIESVYSGAISNPQYTHLAELDLF